jgi:hypothetical protein
MTCHEVEPQLDLLAAGECDPRIEQALERHLAGCVACAASYAESQRLLGMLDLHWDTAGPQRLRERIEAETRRRRRPPVVLPFARQALALAAMLLLMLGLGWLLPRWQTEDGASTLQLAVLVVPDGHRNVEVLAPAHGRDTVAAKVEKSQPEVVLALPAQIGVAFRRKLQQADAAGDLPLPPELAVALALENTGRRPVRIGPGDVVEELSLTVRGEGVVRIQAPAAPEPEWLHLPPRVVAPGGRYVVPIKRLISGARGRVEYIYLTEPGRYTLTAHLELTIGGTMQTLQSGAIHIRVTE